MIWLLDVLWPCLANAAKRSAEDPNPITFKEQDGMDFAATTVKLPDGEYVPRQWVGLRFKCVDLW